MAIWRRLSLIDLTEMNRLAAVDPFNSSLSMEMDVAVYGIDEKIAMDSIG
jgi:hypothetical protein